MATADVIDLLGVRGGDKLTDEARDIVRVDVVADLLSYVSEVFVFPTFEVALQQVGQKAVQLDSAVIWASEAAAATLETPKRERLD